MNMQEKVERLKNSPEWFQKVVLGLDKSYHYSTYLTGKHYAIIKCDGYSWFTSSIGGMRYEPVHYILVEKGATYWGGLHARLWEGRLTDDAIARMKSLLKDFNRTGLSAVEKVRQRRNLREKALGGQYNENDWFLAPQHRKDKSGT